MNSVSEYITASQTCYAKLREDCGRFESALLTMAVVVILVPLIGHPKVKNTLDDAEEGDE